MASGELVAKKLTRIEPKNYQWLKVDPTRKLKNLRSFDPTRPENSKVFKALTRNDPKWPKKHRVDPIFGSKVPSLVHSLSNVQKSHFVLVFVCSKIKQRCNVSDLLTLLLLGSSILSLWNGRSGTVMYNVAGAVEKLQYNTHSRTTQGLFHWSWFFALDPFHLGLLT